MESSRDLYCYFTDGSKDKPAILSDNALQAFDVQFKSCSQSLPTSFEESLAFDSQTSAERLANEADSYLTNSAQINVDNGNLYNVEAQDAINDFGSMGKVFIAGCSEPASNSVTEQRHTLCSARDSSMVDEKSHRSDNMDFGESVALEDFGGDFDDESCTLDTVAQAADIFADETGETSVTASSVLSLPEGAQGSEASGREFAIDHSADSFELCETKESEVAQDADMDCHMSKPALCKTSVPSSKEDSNRELNVNTRPRRSVARKSVFELLQVEYRGSSVSRKHSMESSNVEDSSRRSFANKKKKLAEVDKQCRAAVASEMEVDCLDNFSNVEDHPRTKIICYTPDDFSIVSTETGDGEVHEKAQEEKTAQSDKPVKLKETSVQKRKSYGIFGGQEVPQNSFATEFELASADVLSQCKANDEALKSDSDLIAENRQLRARLKALEESGSNVIKKFKIDVHSRKFSRIRSPPPITGLDRKSLGKGEYLVGSEPSKVSESPDAEEAWKSRSALLDRRENKLREISAELDERTSAVRISEGALQRRERKLIELEKTLEYRQRVLSRHEQNVQKRELELELSDTAEPGTATTDEFSNGEQATLVSELTKRLDLRRQELDRRNNFLDAEREKLVARERLVERREQELSLKLLDHAHLEGTSSSEEDNADVSIKNSSFTKTKAVTRTEPSKKCLVKKTKVSTNSDSTPKTSKKGKIPTSHRRLRKGVEALSATVVSSVNKNKKPEYKLRKRSV